MDGTLASRPLAFPHFEHVIYIIKENRTYDQVLGDLKGGDGDEHARVLSPDRFPKSSRARRTVRHLLIDSL